MQPGSSARMEPSSSPRALESYRTLAEAVEPIAALTEWRKKRD
jgi:hypothetical protein